MFVIVIIFQSHDNWAQPIPGGINDPFSPEQPDDLRGIWNQKNDLSDLNPHRKKEIEHFFQVYKDLEKKKVDVGGWGDAEEACKIYLECVERYELSEHKKKRTFTI